MSAAKSNLGWEIAKETLATFVPSFKYPTSPYPRSSPALVALGSFVCELF